MTDAPSVPGSFSPRSFADMRTYPLASRPHLVSVDDFAGLAAPDAGVDAFIDSLPGILAGKVLRQLIEAIARAHRAGHPVVCAMGAHVIKCGLSPVIIDLMERGIVSAVALNGSGAVHDSEVAAIGKTSEDVGAHLNEGRFGFARETGEAYLQAARRGAEGAGLGRAFGEQLNEQAPPFLHHSILAAGARLGVPVTVHVALGTDIVHIHPGYDGSELGRSSYLDFCILGSVVRALDGGVWLNIGSSVILPEIFLKLVSAYANEGGTLSGMTTANLDMLRHYRPQQNVVNRPAGLGLSLTGHHELMLPLLRVGVLAWLQRNSP